MIDRKRSKYSIDKIVNATSKLEAALAWAEQGFGILALWGVDANGHCECGRAACPNAGKHPIGLVFRHGHKSATTSPSKIRRAFQRFPDANLGIVPPEDVIILDIDGPAGRAAVKDKNLPETATVATGRGEHRYFQADAETIAQFPQLNGVDIKKGNGFVVAPLSKHASGRTYSWSTATDLARLRGPQLFKSNIVTVDFRGTSTTASEGVRNNTLTSYAGILRIRGLRGEKLAKVLHSINGVVCNPPLEFDEVLGIARSVTRYQSASEKAFKNLSSVKEEEVRWLAKPYLVRGALNIIDGNPGLGKSSFVIALAAAVTRGAKLSFTPHLERGRVLLLSAEDDPARVLKPRAVANNADDTRIRIQEMPFALDAGGIELLRSEMHEYRPDLVIIDPMVAYMGGSVDLNKANDMTRFLAEIDLLARECDSCVLLIRHLRKNESEDALQRGMGSIAISGRVRSAMILAPHPKDATKRVIAHAKCNYAPLGPSIIFEMRETRDGRPPKVKWDSTSRDPEFSAERLLIKPALGAGRPDDERQRAKSFLVEMLRSGPKALEEIRKAAESAKISYATLRRAAAEEGVKKYSNKKVGYWKLRA